MTRMLKAVRPTVLRGVAVGACLISLAGCGTSGDGEGAAGSSDEAALALSAQPTVNHVPKVGIQEMPAFPIEKYLPAVGEDARIAAASGEFIRVCMARFGYAYKVPEISQSTLESKENGANRVRRYGVSSATNAKINGYHLPGAGAPAAPGAEAQPMSETENKVFIGDQDPVNGAKPGAKVDGKVIPAGGCSGEAQRKLGIKQRQRMAEKINNVSFARSQENPQVKKALKAWSECMARSGHSYRTPLEPLDDIQGQSAKPTEISAASADVVCKDSVNLAGTWFAIESSIQEELISRNEEVLVADAKMFDSLVRRASAKIAQAG
ncbi:hypothetical protein AB0I52_08310 [Streptomyces sp. NPDC050423]|uniref:hypothetical protein n=1 Tax=Streptomyces sp. NPDC050423 TaxID=3155402 RepID=UPI00342BBE75